MNKKQIFLLIASIAPMTIKGMDLQSLAQAAQEELKRGADICGNQACRQEWVDIKAKLATQPSIDTSALQGVPGSNVSHLHMGNATGHPNYNVSDRVKQRFDILLDPSTNQPSLLNKMGNQFITGFVITVGGLIASSLYKEYMTPKSMRDVEATQTTKNEQVVLTALESDIEKMIRGLPVTKKELETAKDPEHIAYLKDLISNVEGQLQKKLELHKVLTQKFSAAQARRFGVPLNTQNNLPAVAK